MKLLILTTQTTHHTKFIQDIVARWPQTKAILETRALEAPFDTFHDYLTTQESYERDIWFDGAQYKISEVVDSLSVENINDIETLNYIQKFSPDLVIVFGTGKIMPSVIDLMPGRIMNLHGGDPEHYRGLDTHLWAIYHGEYHQLVTCLHEVAPGLDAGAIISKIQLPLQVNMELYQLRAENTKCCVTLVSEAIENYQERGILDTTPQKQKGRYYSFMPAVLKDSCVQKFRKHNL